MDTKIDFRCPRTGAIATVEGCVECYVKRLPGSDRCVVTRLFQDRKPLSALSRRERNPAPKEEPKVDKGPYEVSDTRRAIGCIGIVISTAVILAAIWSGHMEKSEFWRCVCTIAFIMCPISIYIAFPLFSEMVWVVGKGITLGNSQAKALSNLADLDKMLKKA